MASWDPLLCNSLPICLQSSTIVGLKLLHKTMHTHTQTYFHTRADAFTACTVHTSITPLLLLHPAH